VDLDEGYAREHFPVVAGSYVMLAVSDTGIGMSPETQKHIFEPFFTTKEQGRGTGLGLSTVYGIIRQSRGYVWVYSEPDHGTTFKVYLPKVEIEEESTPQKKVKQILGGTETILLVEDEAGIRKLTQECLASKGYSVLAAQDGKEALKIAEQHQEAIDLLLTDVVLPGLGGPKLAKQYLGLHPETQILYMSGYTDDAIIHHGVLDQGIAFLQKPFTIDDLWLKVREVLDAKEGKKSGAVSS
jgi:CheY-like chemotaxis protein